MEAAAKHQEGKSVPESLAEEAEAPSCAPHIGAILEHVRQAYLDALPIAAAIFPIGRRPRRRMRQRSCSGFIAEWDERMGDAMSRGCRS